MNSDSGESAVFSEPHQVDANLQFQVPTTKGRQKHVSVKPRLKVSIRDVIFPAGNSAYSLSRLFEFSPRSQVRLWDGIAHKQEAGSDFHITNHYKSEPSEDSGGVTFPSRTILLVHPTLRFENLDPLHIYIPLATGEEGTPVKFSRVLLQRKSIDPANLQVQVSFNAPSPLFSLDTIQKATKSHQPKQVVPKNDASEATGQPVYQGSNHLLSAAIRGTRYPSQVSSPYVSRAPNLQFVHPQSPSNFGGLQHPSTVHLQQLSIPAQNIPRLHVPLVQSNTLPTQPGAVQSPAAYKKGLLVLCANCGVHSHNLVICDRCKKPITGRIIELSDNTPRQAKKKIGNNEINEEVVELSSDENEDSQTETVPRVPPGTAMDYQLLSLLSSPQNGREPSSDKVTSDEVIKVLSEITGKSDDSSVFVVLTCSSIRIGTYMVSSGTHAILATFGEIGIYFELPGYNSGETRKVGLPKHQILNLYVYFDSSVSYLRIQTGPKFASWIRKTLNMDEDPNGDCYFCHPIHGQDESQHEFVLMFSDQDKTKVAIMKRLYSHVIVTCDDKTGGVLARKRDVSGRNSLVKVIWDGVNSVRTVTLPTKPATRQSTTSVVPLADMEERKLFHYPYVPQEGNATMGITVHNTDIACLGPEQFLNDQIMDFWIRHVHEQLSPADKERSYFFNTFFYKRLTTKPKPRQQRKTINSFEFDKSLSPAEKRHTRVKGWTKSVDIFNKDFLFIPINESCHWFLVVVCFPGMAVSKKTDARKNRKRKNAQMLPELDENEDPDQGEGAGDPDEHEQDEPMETDGVENDVSAPDSESSPSTKSKNTPFVPNPCIVVFDSLGPDNRCKIFSTIRDYLLIEYKTRKAQNSSRRFDSAEVPGYQPVLPLQPNGCDCGLYVLQYTEAFFRNPIMDFTRVHDMDLENWFLTSAVTCKREEIYGFIVDFVEKNFPENLKYIPDRGATAGAGTSRQCLN